MAKAKELFVIMGALTILIAALWFWLYFRPSEQRVADLREEIDTETQRLIDEEQAANQRNAYHAQRTAHYAALQAEWNMKASALPERFNTQEALYHLQDVIYPHTDVVMASFGVSEEREGDFLYSTVVTLTFETSYWQFLSILDNLVAGENNLGNRVVNYEFTVAPMTMDEFNDRVTNRVEELSDSVTQMLRNELRENSGEDIVGLYMLSISMQVEYLSIEPGIITVGELRNIWALMERQEEQAVE